MAGPQLRFLQDKAGVLADNGPYLPGAVSDHQHGHFWADGTGKVNGM
jgi:hypothetical protein